MNLRCLYFFDLINTEVTYFENLGQTTCFAMKTNESDLIEAFVPSQIFAIAFNIGRGPISFLMNAPSMRPNICYCLFHRLQVSLW